MKQENYLIPIIFLLLWSLLSYTGIISEFFIATPSSTIVRLYELVISGDILKDIAWTLYRIFASLFLGSVIGLSLGLLIGLSPKIWNYAQGTVDFFRSLPAFALFPFFILIFGPGDPAKIATATWFIAFIMLISSVYAIREANQTRINSARSLGATKMQTFFYVIVPEGLPQFFVGFRTSLAFAPIVIIATEMFSGTQYGLGDRIYEARLLYQVSDMYAALLISGIIGFSMNKLFLILMEKNIHWSGK